MCKLEQEIKCDCGKEQYGTLILMCQCGTTNCIQCAIIKEEDIVNIYCKECNYVI